MKGVQSGLHTERVALLKNDELFERMFDCKCVSARFLVAKFKC